MTRAVMIWVGAMTLLTAVWGLGAGPNLFPVVTDEFVGPFESWANLKRDYGAVGDGMADDTAAIQKALDDLRSETRKRWVLFIPAGSYRITKTLQLTRTAHNEAKDISIIGEDPATTIWRWDGPVGGTMLDYGAWYSKLSRITLDGAKKARTAIAHGKSFATYNELSDLIVRDVELGIEAGAPGGQGIAETTVLRCRFERCTGAGISIQNFNSLDWFIWHSVFEDCGTGVTNERGAGNYHVYGSIFYRSKEADLSMSNTEYFSIRDNVSVSSQAFFKARPMTACGMITLERNRIFDAVETPIQVGNLGPVLMFDNIIRAKESPVTKFGEQTGVLAIGNSFNVPRPIMKTSRTMEFDNQVVDSERLKERSIALPATPKLGGRTAVEVAAGASAKTIQEAIDGAVKSAAKRVIVHLAAGRYAIDRTLVIPQGSDLQLVGDGGGTRLEWTGSGEGPVLRIDGPSLAIVRDLEVKGGGKAEGILVTNCDQSSARVFMDQPNVTGGTETGLFVDHVLTASVDLRGMNHSDCGVGVKVAGGPPRGSIAVGRVMIFGGSSSNNRLSYEVSEGGSLLARDIWYESGKNRRFVHLRDSGKFTLHGAKVAVADGTEPAVEAENFKGTVALVNTILVGPGLKAAPVRVTGGDAQVMMAGVLVGRGGDHFQVHPGSTNVALRFGYQYVAGGGAEPIADAGSSDESLIRLMLGQTRREQPRFFSPLPAGRTDLRFYRVQVSGAKNCIRLAGRAAE